MKRLLSILWVLLWVLPVAAQFGDGRFEYQRPVMVESAQLHVEGKQLSLNLSVMVAGCEQTVLAEQFRQDNIIHVDLYTMGSPDDPACLPETTEATIALDGEFEIDESYALLINDFASPFFIARPDGSILDVPVLVVREGDNELVVFRKTSPIVDRFVIDVTAEDTLQLTLGGSYRDGCMAEAHTLIRPDRLRPSLVHVDIFRLLPVDVLCPAALTPFEQTIDTGLPSDGSIDFQLQENLFSYEGQGQTQLVGDLRSAVQVEDVAITPINTGLDLTIETIIDTCAVETEVEQVITDEAIFLHLFRDIPVAMTCPQTFAPVEETLSVRVIVEDTRLPVVINGFVFPAIITSPPPVEATQTGDAQSNSAESGNFMRVPHVINDVQVGVLESFPMQLTLSVQGEQTDGCQVPVQVEQMVDGNTVTVEIFRELPPDAICPMILVTYDETIPVEGSFTGGTVNIRVNDFTTSVDL